MKTQQQIEKENNDWGEKLKHSWEKKAQWLESLGYKRKLGDPIFIKFYFENDLGEQVYLARKAGSTDWHTVPFGEQAKGYDFV